MRRVGLLSIGPMETEEERRELTIPLRELGWIEGRNLTVERRFAYLQVDPLRPYAEELVRLKVELILTFGTEAAFAGTSFLTPDRLGSFRYGSEHVNIAIDSTRKGGLGTFGYDDEGVPATSGWAVKDGIFVGYLMSRETAAAMGTVSSGTMRADGWL